MRKLRFEQVLCESLLLLMVAVVSARAQDDTNVPSIQWKTSYQEASDESVRDGKPILVRLTASWCGPCQQMKQLTYRDSRVIELVQDNFVPLLIDADQQPDLVASFKITAYPTTLVVAPDLTIQKRLTGFQSAESLVSSLAPLAKSKPSTDASSSEEMVSALNPDNTLKFGFDGFCLVSLLQETKVRKGSPEIVAEHRGQTICFESDEARQKFLQDPEKYWPVANGQCLVSTRDGTLAGRGDPRMAVTWRGRIWLFSDRECQKRFIQSPNYYAREM